MVEEALRDLLPYFEKSKSEDPDLEDHPLQDGRRVRRVGEKNVPEKKSLLEVPRLIDEELLTCTVKQVLLPDNDQGVIDDNIEEVSVPLSGKVYYHLGSYMKIPSPFYALGAGALGHSST